MAASKEFGPHGLVKTVLGCDDDTARDVVRTLGAPMGHRATRAFIAKAWHLGQTTVPRAGKTHDIYVNEGKRMAGLFLAACAEANMDLSTYTIAKEDTE